MDDKRKAALCTETPLAVQKEDSTFGMEGSENGTEKLRMHNINCGHEQWDFKWADDVEKSVPQPHQEPLMLDAIVRQLEALELQVRELTRERAKFAGKLSTQAIAKICLCQKSDHHHEKPWKGQNLPRHSEKTKKIQRIQSLARTTNQGIVIHGKTKYVPHTYNHMRGQDSPRGSGSNQRVINHEKVTCTFCKKPGHIGRFCRKRKKYQREETSMNLCRSLHPQ